MSQWLKIYATRNPAEASIVQGLLSENEIPVQIMNKMDNSYLNFGDIEVYVPSHLKDVARELLNQALLN
ncbi:MAG: DUF2007 domain-containing protein [Chitinophagales bacterium]|nr:DUF2007 domain-containing protein [Chitinophagales bacterium]